MEVADTVGAQLIPVVNKLQEVCSLLKEPLIDLPQIVVIGGQSSGKSSVLENLVGRDFLPRGSGLVTRVPLVLQLYREQGEEEWGEFSHTPGKRFSFPQIRAEIEAQTERLTGKNKAISHTPIILKVYSPNVLPLTLVDTPGMTRVPVGDQPPDIEQRIRKLINEYINQPNSIILAVQAANQDLATSDALNLARAADPHGERTVGVLTKLDIMDRGTSAVSTLMGDNIALKLGFIGIVNRSQEDINKGKAVKDALETERQFFRTHHEYSSIQNLGNLGTLALANKCSRLLGQHIQRVLPTLRNQVRKAIKEKQELLHSLGTPVVQEKSAQGWLLLHLLNKYGDHFRSAIDGIPDELTTNQLNGGARIRHVFHDTFSKHMERIDPLEGLSAQDIKTAIRNAAGPRPSLFVPERAFELLVKKQLELLREPSLRCAEMIADELYRLVNQLDLPEIQRFKELKVRVADVAHTTIRKTLKPCNRMIEDILACEGAYLNTNHADFIGTQLLSSSVKEQVASETIEEIPVKPAVQTEQKRSGFFGRLFGGSQDDEAPRMQVNPIARAGTAAYKPVVDPFQDADSLSERDKTQIKLLRQLVRSYFKISQRNLQDQVIKATMHFLVNQVKEKLQSDLVGALYKEELFELLLAEDPSMANKRRLTADQVDTLKQAKKIIQSAELSDLSPSGVDFK